MNFEDTIRSYVKAVILPTIPVNMGELDASHIMSWRSRLHAFRYCYQQRGLRVGIVPIIDRMLDISQSLWDLVLNNAEALAAVRDVKKVRQLGLGANLIGQIEEVLSGEDTTRDIIANTIAILLSWKSDSLWVKMAKADHSLVIESHLTRLQDAIWLLLGDFAAPDADVHLSSAIAMSDKINELLSLVTDPDVGVLVFVAQIYTLLLQLYTRQLSLELGVREC